MEEAGPAPRSSALQVVSSASAAGLRRGLLGAVGVCNDLLSALEGGTRDRAG
jgi:hypothetical protein